MRPHLTTILLGREAETSFTTSLDSDTASSARPTSVSGVLEVLRGAEWLEKAATWVLLILQLKHRYCSSVTMFIFHSESGAVAMSPAAPGNNLMGENSHLWFQLKI